jgi:plastocyanin
MLRVRLLALAVFVVAALAACTSSAADTWTYAPASPATPVPSTVASPSAAPSAVPTTAASPVPSGGSTLAIQLEAKNIQYDKQSMQAPSGQPFDIQFHNADAGVPHNVDIKDASGTSVFKGEIFSGDATKIYQVPALDPGNYTFACDVHPNMTGTLVVTGN